MTILNLPLNNYKIKIASILSVLTISKLIMAYCFNVKLQGAFNVSLLKDSNLKEFYSIDEDCSLSVPVEISYMKIVSMKEYQLLEFEKKLLKQAIENLYNEYDIIEKIVQ